MKMAMGRKLIVGAGLLVLGVTCGTGRLAAQAAGAQSQAEPAKPATAKDKTQDTVLTLGNAPAAPVPNPEETAAFKAFMDLPMSDVAKKIQLAEGFVQKYPQSRNNDEIAYSTLTFCYLVVGQPVKVREAGEKAIALNGNDVNVLAIMAMTLPRSIDANDKDPGKTLAVAEGYAKHAIELLPTLPKPPAISDEVFANSKNEVLYMAHNGLGLVYLQRGQTADAIPEFELSARFSPEPDPVTLFLLGVANQQVTHFDDAISAFSKCAAIPGDMQDRCKARLEQAKKSAATQLSAPK